MIDLFPLQVFHFLLRPIHACGFSLITISVMQVTPFTSDVVPISVPIKTGTLILFPGAPHDTCICMFYVPDTVSAL